MNVGAVRVIEPAQWLEVIEGAAPMLLIAPHGGRAGRASQTTLHPKVNDLETAAITRESCAASRRRRQQHYINAGMDRNEIDCNRLSQLAARAPWMLDLIAQSANQIVQRHGHATVLLLHGWNVIEPRLDFGLGLRDADGRLRPPVAGARYLGQRPLLSTVPSPHFPRVSKRPASFQPSACGYPGGASQNLLQAFTQRHAASEIGALRQLAGLASGGAIDALQLELSVAVRMAGSIRDRGLDALTEIFLRTPRGDPRRASSTAHTTAIVVERSPKPKVARNAEATPLAPPLRVGIEFYDPAARIGGMASFDFGSGAAGARIMLLFDGCRAALFTGEGKATHDRGALRLGPLELPLGARSGTLAFGGPAVVVKDGAAYLSVEKALAQGQLDTAMSVTAAIDLDVGTQAAQFPDGVLDGLIDRSPGAAANASGNPSAGSHTALFGRLRGAIVVGGVRREVIAVARVGASFTGLEPLRFETRRMLWACFPDAPEFTALEARAWTFGVADPRHTARLLYDTRWRECELAAIELETPATGERPDRISASIIAPDGESAQLRGVADSFMTLSRPGQDNSRIHTLDRSLRQLPRRPPDGRRHVRVLAHRQHRRHASTGRRRF